LQAGFRAAEAYRRLLGALADFSRVLLARLAHGIQCPQGGVLHESGASSLEPHSQGAPGEQRLNPIWVAPESFTTDVPLPERLDDLLVFGLATGRLTDQEAELVEIAFANEARGRHAVERQWDEDYQRWLAGVAGRGAGRRWEDPKSVQPFRIHDAKPAAHEPRQLHLLVNRIPTLEEFRFRVVDGVAVAEQEGYVVHFACDLPGVFIAGHVGELWKVTLEGGSARAVLGRGVGGAEVANRARPDLAAVDVVLSTNRYDYDSGRASGQYPGTITGRLTQELHIRFPDLAGQQQTAIAQQAERIKRHGLDLAEQVRRRQSWAMAAGSSPPRDLRAGTSPGVPRHTQTLRSGG